MLNANFSILSPLDPVIQVFFGSYLSLIFILCLFVNILFIILYIKYDEIRSNTTNLFILFISILNLTASLTLPLVIHSTFSYKWTSAKLGCILVGFVTYFTSCASLYMMAFISIQRYYILLRPLMIRKLNNKKIIKICLICCLLGLFWSVAPLLGWSHYSLESGRISCSVEWKNTKKSMSVLSYNISIFIFIFILPFGLITITQIKSIVIVSIK